MNLGISDDLHLYSQELERHLSPLALTQLAKETGFVTRTSKYRAQDLVALCVWVSQRIATTSFNQLCSTLEATTGILMSPEGLNQRFNSAAVRLLQQIVSLLLQQTRYSSGSIPSEYSGYFSRSVEKAVRLISFMRVNNENAISGASQGTPSPETIYLLRKFTLLRVHNVKRL